MFSIMLEIPTSDMRPKKNYGKEINGNYLKLVHYILYQLHLNKAVKKKPFCLDPDLT